MIITALIFIATIALLIAVHEGAHFTAAKLSGVWVHQMAIGFGPPILRYRGKETEYSLRIFPVGGYARMAGEDQETEEDKKVPEHRKFNSKSPLKRMFVVLAGPFSNIFLSLFIMIAVVGFIGIPYLEVADFTEVSSARSVLQVGDKVAKINGQTIYSFSQLQNIIQKKGAQQLNLIVIRDGKTVKVSVSPRWDEETGRYLVGAYFSSVGTTSKIEQLEEGSFLANQGLKSGDVIKKIDGTPVSSFTEFIKAVREEETINLTVLRDDREIEKTINIEGKEPSEVLSGVNPEIVTRSPGFFDSFKIGTIQVKNILVLFYQGILAMIRGQIPAGEAVSGPVGIANYLGQSYRQGPLAFFTLLSLISLNLGIINLIPFPALDGSRAGFIVYEMIRGKPIPPEREGLIHYLGFIILIGLMLFITFKDILNLIE